MQYAAVLVDNKDILQFLQIREGTTGRLNLTTIVPEQSRVNIEIYIVDGRRRTHVHTFSASGLTEIRHPEIIVSGYMRSELVLTLRVNGELVSRVSVSAIVQGSRSRLLPLFLISFFVIAAVVGTWFLVDWLRDSATTRRLEAAPSASVETDGAEIAPAAPALAEPDSTEAASATDESAADAADVEADLTTDRTWIVYFAAESTVLLPEAVVILDDVSVKDDVSVTDDVFLRITGHTALYDNEDSRLQLSVERADAVTSYLTARGVNVEIRSNGVGGTQPVTTGRYEQWLNRRVEIEQIIRE